jgi:NIPSNAP
MIAIAKANSKTFIRKTQQSIAMFSSAVTPIIELREYAIKPECSVAYVQATSKASELRKSLVPIRLFSFPDTGGQLHTATHAYYYGGGHAERDAKRNDMAASDEWKAYLSECRPYMQTQQSNIFVEAPLVQQFDEISGLAGINKEPLAGSDCILEFRRYKLILGYDTVPKFMTLYASGLPSKLHAEGTDPTTSLVTLLHCEVGRLNEVIEIWRHGDGHTAMERSRNAARGALEWKKAIGDIAPLAIEFTSTIHRPLDFSPLK